MYKVNYKYLKHNCFLLVTAFSNLFLSLSVFLPFGKGSSSLSSTSSSGAPRKRLQRVEILKIAEPRPLIDPSQVVVTKGEIFVADPVLTPIGNTHFLRFSSPLYT